MKKYAGGMASTTARSTNFKKSLAKRPVMPATLAPNTLRMPISLVRRSAVKAYRANRPRQAINKAKPVNTLNTAPIRASERYMRP